MEDSAVPFEESSDCEVTEFTIPVPQKRVTISDKEPTIIYIPNYDDDEVDEDNNEQEIEKPNESYSHTVDEDYQAGSDFSEIMEELDKFCDDNSLDKSQSGNEGVSSRIENKDNTSKIEDTTYGFKNELRDETEDGKNDDSDYNSPTGGFLDNNEEKHPTLACFVKEEFAEIGEFGAEKAEYVGDNYQTIDDLIIPPGIIDDPGLIADLHDILTHQSRMDPETIIINSEYSQVVDVVDEKLPLGSCTVEEIEEDYDDIEETYLERLYGLSEMFNENFVSFVSESIKGVSKASVIAINVTQTVAWLASAGFIMAILAPLIEIENIRIEEGHLAQQRQMLAGSGSQMMQPGSLSPSPISGSQNDQSML